MPKRQYIERLKLVVEQLHKCSAQWLKTVPVHEVFQGKTVWRGDVEVFNLTGHIKANRAYAWSYDDPEKFITILELPPVKSAQDAVKVGIAHQVRESP